MSIHYLREIPPGSFLVDRNHVLIQRSVFEKLADYTRSSPTGASPGRVWKRNMHWSGPPANWFAFICDVDPNDGKRFYLGRPVLLVD